MKIFTVLSVLMFFIAGCSAKKPPLTDISNAKMALVKVDVPESASTAPKLLATLKSKFKNLQALMKAKRYEEAQFLAQEIQADARLLEKKSQHLLLEKEAQKLQGEINLITKDFAQIRE